MKIRVVGVGNLLLGDEGIGVHAAHALEAETWPPEVQIVDGGTSGLSLLDLLENVTKVIFIDAADMKLPPGSWRRFRPEEVRNFYQRREMSLHDTGLLEVLALAHRMKTWPEEVVIYGIQPGSVERTLELSAACRTALADVLTKVREEICQSL